jgi:hypothetical protein
MYDTVESKDMDVLLITHPKHSRVVKLSKSHVTRSLRKADLNMQNKQCTVRPNFYFEPVPQLLHACMHIASNSHRFFSASQNVFFSTGRRTMLVGIYNLCHQNAMVIMLFLDFFSPWCMVMNAAGYQDSNTAL